eukprot:m.18425 g.18425  ORF g.18425 m.18425 type:complete len:100 (-) comp30113_c0_seq1:166-465(-)
MLRSVLQHEAKICEILAKEHKRDLWFTDDEFATAVAIQDLLSPFDTARLQLEKAHSVNMSFVVPLVDGLRDALAPSAQDSAARSSLQGVACDVQLCNCG